MDANLTLILKTIEKYLPPDTITERNDYFTMPTICHNEDYKHASHKLYLYRNEGETPLFHCYTECGETFNVYQFVQKVEALRGKDLTFREAYRQVHGKDYTPISTNTLTKTATIWQSEFVNPLETALPEYNANVLDMFSIGETHPWRLEGIDPLYLHKFKVGYSKSFQVVSIPHFDLHGRLIGVRVRNFDPEKIKRAKYVPLYANNLFHAHPLSLNLYGIWENAEKIKTRRKVYLFEGEKSAIQFEDMFGMGIGLAVCGASISEWHVNALIHYLGVREVVIAFDKEYSTYSEAFKYVEKLKSKTAHLKYSANVSVLIDDTNQFALKESPTDRTVKEFTSMKAWEI